MVGKRVMVVVGLLVLGGGWRIRDWREWRQRRLREVPIRLETQIVSPVIKEEYGCRLDIKGIRVYISQAKCMASNIYQASAGDVISLEGEINPRGEVKATTVKIEPAKPLPVVSLRWWLRTVGKWRDKTMSVFRQTLPEPESSLMAGIVLGQKTTLPDDFYEALIKTGTMHVVAASGYNVAVIAAIGFQGLIRWWSRKQAAVGTLIWVWIYVILAGAEPPVVRAGLMGSVMLIAWITGRDYWNTVGFGLSVAVMVMIAPWLIESVSFQLSVAATAGVIFVARGIGGWMQKWINFSEKNYLTKLIMENGVTTLAAVVTTAPISLMVFGEVSWLGLVVNPLVLSLIPVLMYLGMAELLLGIIWLPLAAPISWLLMPLARVWTEVITLAGAVPGGLIRGQVNGWMALGWWICWLGMTAAGIKRGQAR